MDVKSFSGEGFQNEFLGLSPEDIPDDDLRFFKCVRSAKKRQPKWWNPRNPQTAMSRKLFRSVNKTLGEMNVLNNNHFLEYYSAIKTVLDYNHGADAFFVFAKYNVVTIDLTIMRKKRHRKADFLVRRWDVVKDRLEIIGQNIAMLLVQKKFKCKLKEGCRSGLPCAGYCQRKTQSSLKFRSSKKAG